jgi:hypothetical protein
MKKVISLLVLLILFSSAAKSQVLISLLLGDKLNSPNLEFGLIGGMSASDLSNSNVGSQNLWKLHLGFYFDFKITDKLWFNPAVLVKVTPGMKYTNQRTNVSGIDELDSILVGATVERRIGYFQVPLLLKYNFTPRFHLLLGPQAGLRTNKASNNYSVDVIDKDDLTYREDVSEEYKRLDFGIAGGFGFRIKPGGMNLGARYYYGLTDILKDNPGAKLSNRNLYLYFTIPVGKG